MPQEEKLFDIAIIGGGLAGVLMANRLHTSFQGKVLLVDSHPSLGGRARSSSWESKQWAPNSGFVSEKLHNFMANLFQSDPLLETTEPLEFKPASLALFVQNKVLPLDSLELKESKIPKTLGGMAGQKQWLNLWDKIFGSLQDNEHLLSKSLHLTHKDSLASTLKLISYTCGLSNWLSSIPKAVSERCQYFSSLGKASIFKNLNSLFSTSEDSCDFTLASEEQVISAHREENLWLVKTNKQKFKAKRLIVAHSPWEALTWLDRKELPTKLLQMTLRSKPTSVVSLTKRIKTDCEGLYDQMIIASESTLMHRSYGNLCFNFSLDYESSISANEVTKAIKALRRAAIKLEKFFPELELEEESIALHPIAWGQSAQAKDKGFVSKLEDYDYFRKDLLFCGDSYGTSYRPDENIIKSVLACASYCAENQLGD